MRALELAGQRFGLLVVLARRGSDKEGSLWLCRCDCGVERLMRGQYLQHGHAISCGCWRKSGAQARQHGDAVRGHRATEYVIWAGIRNRCSNPAEPAYARYGGRGIRVCERWDSYQHFLADMGRRPPLHSIDRIDNDGDYEPGNCRWATRAVQNQNRRTAVWLDLDGERLSLMQWARRLGIARETIGRRLRSGWTVEAALRTPVSHEAGRFQKKSNRNPGPLFPAAHQ